MRKNNKKEILTGSFFRVSHPTPWTPTIMWGVSVDDIQQYCHTEKIKYTDIIELV